MTNTDLPASVDTIVVGAGTGGAAFAGMLAQHSDETILVLEAGPDYGSYESGNWPADMLNAKSIPLSHDLDLTSVTGLDLPRARIVGGCSAHNGCTASRSARLDYDEWATASDNPGWRADTVEPLLDWVHERFRVRRYRRDELTVAQEAFVAAGVASGLPFADDLDDFAAAEGIGPMPVNIVDGVRWNAAFAFLDPVRARPNLTIVGNVSVDRVVLDDGHAAGVVARRNGTTTTVLAKRVVIAAGAYHSPTILQRSGIGPAQVLADAGIDLVVDRPGVGAHLLDHACIQLDFEGRPGLLDELALKEWNPDEQSLGRARSSRCDDGPYDIHVFMVAGANSGHPDLPPVSLYGGAMRAVSEGHVTIRTADPDVEPVIDHAYGTDPDGHDRAVLADALDLLRTMTSQPVLADVLGPEHRPDRDPLAEIVSYCHPAGTCKMGRADDPAAVVGGTGEVHGVQGLYVADASVMPAITRGNVNLPTAMIGARIAAFLLDLDTRTAVAEPSSAYASGALS